MDLRDFEVKYESSHGFEFFGEWLSMRDLDKRDATWYLP